MNEKKDISTPIALLVILIVGLIIMKVFIDNLQRYTVIDGCKYSETC